MLPKQIIRDTARVMNIDIRVVDNICKTIKDEKTFDELKNNKDYFQFPFNYKYFLKMCGNKPKHVV